MDKHLYFSLIPEALIASQLPPEKFGQYYATGYGYKMWAHETGTDEVDGMNTQPIQSYFETGEIALPISQGKDASLRCVLVEPAITPAAPGPAAGPAQQQEQHQQQQQQQPGM